MLTTPPDRNDSSARNAEWKTIALEEWRQLEAKVTRHANLAFQTRGWMFGLLTALQIAAHTKTAVLTPREVFCASGLVVIMFLFMELIQRISQSEAIGRSSEVEEALRAERSYDGPRISLSMSMGGSPRMYFRQLTNQIVWIPYTAVLSLISLLARWS